MNINDVKEEIEVPKNFVDIWKAIFEKQQALADKYSDIEKMGDLLQTTKNNVDTAKGQKWIKDFAWRVTEELAEAFEAKELMARDCDATDASKTLPEQLKLADEYTKHFKEELADALHFLVELTIIAGYNHEIVTRLEDRPFEKVTEKDAWPTVYKLGLLCNCLKNKPWKQTQMLTDRPKFEKYLEETWTEMLRLLFIAIGTNEEIYIYYFKKNAVNQFRQRSKY